MIHRRASWKRPFTVAAGLALAASLVAGSPVAQPGAVSATGPAPVAEWTFDEGAGSTAADSVGNLDGAITGGATWTTGANGSAHAIQFNGTDGLVTVANNATLEPAGNFTLSLWVKGGATTENVQHTILQKGDYGCDVGGSYRFGEAWNGTPDVFNSPALVDVGLTAAGFAYPGSFSYQRPAWDGNWHHLLLVVEDSADRTSAWIDGYKTTTIWNNPDTVRFGSAGRLDAALHFGGPGADCPSWKPFNGALDDVQLYGSALTDAQIYAMSPTYDPTVSVSLGYWTLPSTPIPPVINDREIFFDAVISPMPGVDGTTTWYLSKGGAAEEVIGTSALAPGGNGQTILRRAAGTLEPGSYTIRAQWEGAENWTAASSPATPFDVIKRPVDLTLSASPTDDVAGGGSTLTAKIRILDPISTDAVTGGIEFHDITGGGDVLVGTSPLSYVGSPDWNRATIDVSGLALGTHVYEARYAGSTTLGSDMATTNVVIGPQFSYVSLEVTPNPVLNTAHATATVTLSTGRKGSGSGGTLPAATGTITLKRMSTGATIGTAPVNGPGPYTFQVPIYPTGTVALVAEYSGDANFDPSTGNQVDLVVLTDVVDATGVGLGATTFYPVVDGYKDSVAIKGLRNEPISVEIRIYNSTNHLVRARSVASGTGAYSVYWNGRSTSGILQPGGTYRIVQTLTDAKSHHLVVSKTVAISRKKLYYTTKTLTKYADAAASVGHYGGGIAYKYSDHSVRAYASGGWVGIGWQFTLPSATTYKSLSVGIYGTSGTPIAHFGSQNFSLCSYSSTWSADCFDHMTAMRSTSAGNGWASRAVSPTYNRYGHAVRVNFSQYSGSSHFYKVRVIVTYGILK